MQRAFSIKNRIESLKEIDFNEILCGLILFSLPISTILNSVFLGFFFLFNVVRRVRRNKFKDIWIYYPCLIVFGIQIISYFLSDNKVEAGKKVMLFASFLFLSFLCVEGKKPLRINHIYKFFLYGVLIVILYAFLRGAYDVVILNERYDYGRGPELILKYSPHHAYLSMYLLASILAIVYFVGVRKMKSYYLFFLPILYLTIFILPSRTAIFIGILILPFFVFYFLKNRFNKIRMLTILAFTLIFLVIMGFSIDFTRDKIMYTFYELSNVSIEDKPFLGISRRQMIWNSSIGVIKETPFFGYGIGDAQIMLDRKYAENGYSEILGINAHNQMLQNAISYGIFLSSIFLLVIAKVMYSLIKKKEYFLLGIWVIILFFFMTESILNRQWGVIFFTTTLTISIYTLKCHGMSLRKEVR